MESLAWSQAQSASSIKSLAVGYLTQVNKSLEHPARFSLGYLTCLRCVKGLKEFGAASKKCHEELESCGDDLDKLFEFLAKYEPRLGFGLSGSLLECVLQKLGDEEAGKIAKRCSKCSVTSPMR